MVDTQPVLTGPARPEPLPDDPSPPPVLRRLLWSCAGANPQILALCPSEHQRYACLGTAVLTSSTLAAISGTVALATAANRPGPAWIPLLMFAPLGVLYGAAIFGIDRFLVSNSLNPIPADQLTNPTTPEAASRSPGRLVRIVAAAAPRLALAALIGVLVAEPLLLWMFHTEIDQRILHTTSTRLQAEIDQIDTDYHDDLNRITAREQELTATDPALADAIDTLAGFDTEISDVDNQLADLQVTLRSEISGLNLDGTSGRAGDGPVAEEIRAEIDLATNRRAALVEQRQGAQDHLDTLTTTEEALDTLTTSELDTLARERTDLTERRAADVAAGIQASGTGDGLLARIDALEWLTRHDLATGQRRSVTNVGIAVWLVRLWILLLDATPMLFKILLSVRSDRPYEMMLAAQQQREINLARSLTHRTPHPAAAPATVATTSGESETAEAAVSGPGKRVRYPAELRRQAVQMVHDTEAAGATSRWDAILTVSRALGPSPETVRTWIHADTTASQQASTNGDTTTARPE